MKNKEECIEEIIEILELKIDISKLKDDITIEAFDTPNNTNKNLIFETLKHLLNSYCAESTYHIRLIEFKQKEDRVNFTLIIGDFYWGGMYSSKYQFEIK